MSLRELRKFKAELFKAIANPSRIHILDALRDGERSVNELCKILDSQGSGVSQQLAVLRNKNLVKTRKEANIVYYSIQDSSVYKLLDLAKKIFDNHLINLQSHLED